LYNRDASQFSRSFSLNVADFVSTLDSILNMVTHHDLILRENQPA
jgi:hypothetical protein